MKVKGGCGRGAGPNRPVDSVSGVKDAVWREDMWALMMKGAGRVSSTV